MTITAVLIAAALAMGLDKMAPPPLIQTVSAPVEVGGDTIVVPGVPQEIAAFLEEGRAWRAARGLRAHLGRRPQPEPEEVLLAARAEAEWGGWEAARAYLEGRTWLDEVWEGEGWYWLGRAREEAGALREALDAYDRFLALHTADDAPRAAIAELRRGLVLLGLGRVEAGAGALAAVTERAPYIADWMAVLAAEALVSSGDTASIRGRIAGLSTATGLRHRGRMALLRGYEAAGDPDGAARTAIALRTDAATASERAELTALVGRIALARGDVTAARRELRQAMDAAPASAAARESAALLSSVGGLSAAERLAIAEIYDRHGNRARAAEGYRAVLAEGGGAAAERNRIRLSLGRALFEAGQFAAAEEALAPLPEADASLAREALLITGRSQYRRGDQQRAFATLRRLADRFPGSAEGSEGLFLVADLNHDAGSLDEAGQLYRRVASDFRGTDRAGLSLMRLAGMRYLGGEFAEAAALWEEYRLSYPRGERWAQSTYWAGRARADAGDSAGAAALYRAVREREPLSYYALKAAERLGTSYWPIPMDPAPPVNSAAAQRVAEWMRGVDLLRDAGLHAEADAEAGRLAERAGNDTALLYELAEALNERGYAIRGIRLGQQIERSAGAMNPRLLRILYPLPYRSLVEAEATEKGLDPFMVAALTRQESLFTPRISSPVGARGLMQIMPETGSALARGVGISEWDPELLFHPEINVHLGTVYLAEQMRRYDESLPSVFSAYNAGPHRIDVWREFPEFGDEELFTERIPYRETRDYVKILTRNIALYRGLYGGANR